MTKKRVMISQPMRGLIESEILKAKMNATEFLESKGYEVVDTYFSDFPIAENGDTISRPIYYLAKSIDKMAECSAVYFLKGYEAARGCRIEHAVAKAYGLELLYEKDEFKEGYISGAKGFARYLIDRQPRNKIKIADLPDLFAAFCEDKEYKLKGEIENDA